MNEGEICAKDIRLTPITTFGDMRALAWNGDVLYASRGYRLFKAEVRSSATTLHWELVGSCSPVWWRNLTSRTRLTFRLVRDGFHALAVLPSGAVVAAVPGAIVTLAPGERKFRVTHRVTRGTRPLHVVATPDGRAYWGEYFDNAARDDVHIYGSTDGGESWQIVYTFARGAVRHVHNVVFDQWNECLWVLTGDYGDECRVLRASTDFNRVETVLSGNQQTRAVAAVPSGGSLFFATDTPLEQNYVYRMDREGARVRLAPISSSSLYGCAAGGAIFFSTMIEPSHTNPDRHVRIFGSRNERNWQPLVAWRKDTWPMGFFQYGNAFLPDGENRSGCLALTTAAVQGADQMLTLFRVE